MKRKKEEVRLNMEQLVEKRKKEVEDKSKVGCTAKKWIEEQEEEEERDSGRSHKSPS